MYQQKQNIMKEIIKLDTSYNPKTKLRSYVIYKYMGPSIIGAMWDILHKGTREEMITIFNSEKYAEYKKINELN